MFLIQCSEFKVQVPFFQKLQVFGLRVKKSLFRHVCIQKKIRFSKCIGFTAHVSNSPFFFTITPKLVFTARSAEENFDFGGSFPPRVSPRQFLKNSRSSGSNFFVQTCVYQKKNQVFQVCWIHCTCFKLTFFLLL